MAEPAAADDDRHAEPDPARLGRVKPSTPRCLPSQALFAGSREVLIEHHGELYRLRRTANGKLILTK